MKTLATSAKNGRKNTPPHRRRSSKWIVGDIGDATITKAAAARFTDGLLAIAARIEGLPPDFARNHDHYLHGLPKK